MAKTHTIDTLRKHLFDTLEGLTSKTEPIEIERAKAVAEVAQVVINSAKVEVEHARVTGGQGSGFLGLPQPPADPTHSPAGTTVVERPGVRTLTHRLAG